MTLRIEVQNWFFSQILACYQDMAINFPVTTLKTLLESSKARIIDLRDGGFNDHLIVVPACPKLIHVVEREGQVKMVKAMDRADVPSCALFSNLSANDLSIVAGY